MKMRTQIVVIASVLLLLALFVMGAGCQQQGASAQASELDSQFGELENMNQEIAGLNIDEMSDSELDELEGLL